MFLRKILLETINLYFSQFITKLSIHFLRGDYIYSTSPSQKMGGGVGEGRPSKLFYGCPSFTLYVWSDISLFTGILVTFMRNTFSRSVSIWMSKGKIRNLSFHLSVKRIRNMPPFVNITHVYKTFLYIYQIQ